MYLNPQIHGTQDTIKIHVRYICGIHRDTHQDTYLEPYLRPRLDTPKPPRYVSRMYDPHVFRMYPACILISSEDTCISHVSRMSPACLLHIRYISLWMHLRYSDTCISSCILDASRMYLDHPCRYMYLACIPHVSCISDTYLVMTRPRYMYRDFVFRCILCIIRCIMMKSPRYTYPYVS